MAEITGGIRVVWEAPRSLLDNSYSSEIVKGKATVLEMAVRSPLLHVGKKSLLKLTLLTDTKVHNNVPFSPIPDQISDEEATGRLLFWNSDTSPNLGFKVAPIGLCRHLPIDEKVLKLCAERLP